MAGDYTTGAAVSDYEVVGGGPAVSAVVNDFYERVLSDPQLAPYFEGVDLPRLAPPGALGDAGARRPQRLRRSRPR